MVFTKPEDIIEDRNTSLEQREKAELQSLAYSLKTMETKLEKDFSPEHKSQQGTTVDILKNQLAQEPLYAHTEQMLTRLKSEIDFTGIEQSSQRRTPENVAMLQLFLFLKGAYQPDANGKVSEKKIDGKRGRETAEALRNFKNNNPEFVQELTVIQEQKNQIEAPYIAAVLHSAKDQIGKAYRRWGSSERWGFDCSWVWMYAFKKQGIKFDYRPTAKSFFDSNKKINKEEVKAGDFMFWKSKPWANKHSDIYHVEMTVWEPYQENGKWYVKTIGSAKNRDAMDEYGNRTWKAGVWYRIREITPYRKFWRPSYYYQLAENAKKPENIVAQSINSKRNQNEAVS